MSVDSVVVVVVVVVVVARTRMRAPSITNRMACLIAFSCCCDVNSCNRESERESKGCKIATVRSTVLAEDTSNTDDGSSLWLLPIWENAHSWVGSYDTTMCQ